MSMYDLVMGDGKQGARLSAFAKTLLDLDVEDMGRVRDCWLENYDGQLVICILTRNGGGNRPDYEEQITKMRSHALFISDEDWDFDDTYAFFRFQFPPEVPQHCAERNPEGWGDMPEGEWDKITTYLKGEDMSYVGERPLQEHWEARVEKMKTEPNPKQQAGMEQLAAGLQEAFSPRDPDEGGPKVTVIKI